MPWTPCYSDLKGKRQDGLEGRRQTGQHLAFSTDSETKWEPCEHTCVCSCSVVECLVWNCNGNMKLLFHYKKVLTGGFADIGSVSRWQPSQQRKCIYRFSSRLFSFSLFLHSFFFGLFSYKRLFKNQLWDQMLYERRNIYKVTIVFPRLFKT